MARATITKRFELSPEAVAELERRVEASGVKSQTAYIEDWLTLSTAESEPNKTLLAASIGMQAEIDLLRAEIKKLKG